MLVKRIFDIDTSYKKVLDKLILVARDLALKERNRIASIEGRIPRNAWERLPHKTKEEKLNDWDIVIQVLGNHKITQIAKNYDLTRSRVYKILSDYSMQLWHLYRAVKDDEGYEWVEELKLSDAHSLFETNEGRVAS